MTDTTALAVFMIAALTLNVTPGPNMLYVTTRSLGQGRKAGVVSAIGIGVGNLVHTLAAALGLSALLMSSAIAYSVVKYVGAAYLIYLGVRMILKNEHNSSLTTLTDASLRRIFSQAIATSVLNPKVALFFIAFLPQFANPSQGSVALQIAVLGALFSTTGTIVNTTVALLSGSFGDWLQTRPRFSQFQQWFTGSVFVALGTSIALPERK
ncbi:MAG: LysE family translocator [Symplocastrum torsivum CPER-KK1]|jgi:threonine/homoserine/homoserine lactone efflux protein|uniref:LysE family translocator n=1 Tax=Symplocastrum torsivum CPER-KK1 TaxID=450513 RepID=A0A951PLX6_9CYAN|nr:LysE family translocator [Symplocastrum torsivum CPER-KK1]